tara:strand:+ start:7061 stop:7705 length:645 start_codon:yes stop_codon:yes gene_type:complete
MNISEKFKSIQGEGVYCGTPMAFIRFQGCSVGKKICTVCDTDFEHRHSFRGGGTFTGHDLREWSQGYNHICLTGGEPLDQEYLKTLYEILIRDSRMIHIETSGTKRIPDWMEEEIVDHKRIWLTVSPKPGYLKDVIDLASEVKVIVPGLGNTTRDWPTLSDALQWEEEGAVVFLQPRNDVLSVDKGNLKFCIDACAEYPSLRLSVQMHKILGVQ